MVGACLLFAACQFHTLGEGALSDAPSELSDEGADVVAVASVLGTGVQSAGDGSYAVSTAADEVVVTLDASASQNRSGGGIAEYRWTVVGQPTTALTSAPGIEWPGHGEQVPVTLSEGVWVFSLVVTDESGTPSTSVQISIDVEVGVVEEPVEEEPEGDPAVLACVDELQTPTKYTANCQTCLCEQGTQCQQEAPLCGPTCWDVILCVQSNCDFSALSPNFDDLDIRSEDVQCILRSCEDELNASLEGIDPDDPGANDEVKARVGLSLSVGLNCGAPCQSVCDEEVGP